MVVLSADMTVAMGLNQIDDIGLDLSGCFLRAVPAVGDIEGRCDVEIWGAAS